LLARNQVRNQVAIRRVRGGDQMIKLLASTVTRVQRNAALALGAYCLNNNPIQQECSRAIPQLVKLLDSATQSSTNRTVAAALASLADNNKINQNLVQSAGGLGAVIALLPIDKNFTRCGLHVIAALVCRNTSAQNSVVLEHPRFIPDLLALLTNSSPSLQTHITNTLVELVKKNTLVQKNLYHADATSRLAALLRAENPQERAILNVLFLLWTLWHLRKYKEKIRAEFSRQQVAENVRLFCASRNKDIQELAMNLSKEVENRKYVPT